ncbi:S1 family peptidase [Streptomyces sp. 6N223]|uniref:S1 family peptidase n=1 Tax=Streptomyces sp. 6N223 TaxID=3457412 RepID=UPI003FD03526
MSRPRSREARRARPLVAVAALLATALAAPASGVSAPAAAEIGGTAWSVAPGSGAVRVLVDETVTDEEIARLTASGATVERTPGTLSPRLRAGEAVHADAGWRCTAGLNVSSGSASYFLTAGHCATGLPSWYADAAMTTHIGPTEGASFPSDDFGLVRYANASVPHPSQVTCNGAAIDITGAGDATVGQSVTFSGATSGCHSGVITGLNATVNYGGDVVSGLIETNICTEPGDSGGLLFAGDTAIGILSGGSGSCATGGASYFQPITEAMAHYGVSIP